MTKKYFLIKLLALGLLISLQSQAQDLFDYAHARQFAEHLAKSGQFDMAQKEYERLVFMQPNNDTLRLGLLRSYRLGSKFQEGIARGQQLYEPLALMPPKQALEYGKMLVGANQLDAAQSFWSTSKTLGYTDVKLLESTVMVLKDNFLEAQKNMKQVIDSQQVVVEDYQNLLTMAVNDIYKKPGLAGVLSAIVPSTGRFYAKDGKDAIVSLLFIASTAFQSYRGFNKTGIQSVKGWAYGAVSFGFYLGNIYGSVKAAQAYNQRKKHGYREGILQLFNGKF